MKKKIHIVYYGKFVLNVIINKHYGKFVLNVIINKKGKFVLAVIIIKKLEIYCFLFNFYGGGEKKIAEKKLPPPPSPLRYWFDPPLGGRGLYLKG